VAGPLRQARGREIGGEEAHPPTNAQSTSDPRHAQDDPEGADRWEAPKRENLDQ
jgi:hypothetical protein